jgi:peptidoglycan/xylan/chitin deacetylase (PgdA/CDA1 family)
MTSRVITLNRRAVLALGAAAAAVSLVARAKENTMSTSDQFWPNNARVAVSFSLMFEAGGQPISGAPGSFGPIEKGAPDLATNGLFQYGVYEGIPRILDLMDKHQVKLSSFMIGQAVDKAPDLAREIVRRGHEAAAHGRTWQNSYLLDPDAERRFITDGMESIHKATGQKTLENFRDAAACISLVRSPLRCIGNAPKLCARFLRWHRVAFSVTAADRPADAFDRPCLST